MTGRPWTYESETGATLRVDPDDGGVTLKATGKNGGQSWGESWVPVSALDVPR